MSLTTIRIAWRNLSRNKRRTALAVGAIATGQLALVFINGMMAGMFVDMLNTITGPLVGHVQVHHAKWREERAVDFYVDRLHDVVAQIASLPDVVSVLPRIYAPVLAASGEASDQPPQAEVAMLVGVQFDAERRDGGLLKDVPLGRTGGGAVLGHILANRLGVREGEQLAVIGQDADEFPVSELFEIRAIISSPVDMVNTMGIVIPLERAQALLALTDQAHELVVMGTDFRQADQLAAQVKALPLLQGTEVLTWQQAVPELAGLMDFKGWFDFLFVVILFIAAAAGIANTAMMSTFERLREFGMLLALGARPVRIIGMILVESVIIGTVGVVIGSIAGTAVVLLTSRTGIDYAAFGGIEADGVAIAGLNISYVLYPMFEFRQVAYGFIAVCLTSVVASTWPATLAARLEPVRALRS